eukprot:2978749-Amphidinium_carterae.1
MQQIQFVLFLLSQGVTSGYKHGLRVNSHSNLETSYLEMLNDSRLDVFATPSYEEFRTLARMRRDDESRLREDVYLWDTVTRKYSEPPGPESAKMLSKDESFVVYCPT